MKTLTSLLILMAISVAIFADDREPQELSQARTAWQRQLKSATDPINQNYFQTLDALKKKFGGLGDLENAQKVQKEIDVLSGKPDTLPAVKENIDAINNAVIYAICDNVFTFCVNGKEICSGDTLKVVQTDASIKKGDVITVRCLDFGQPYGFACVVKFKDNKNIKSDTKIWKSYTPMNKDLWFDVKGIQKKKPVTAGTNKEWKSFVVNESSIDCDSIWGETPGGTAYLMYEVK
jgi:hypothetical protein